MQIKKGLFMGVIDILGKWDLENGIWIKNPQLESYGRSFAIANYAPIINNNDKYNYIIIAPGSRVEDHSDDFTRIKEKQVRIDNVLSFLGKKNDNYIVQLFLMDADAPIIEDAKIFADYIERIARHPNTNSVNVIGLSKCAIMSFYTPKFFKNDESYDITNIYNVAAPYDGTKLASPLVFYPEIEDFVSKIIPNKEISKHVSNKLIVFYESISSNSHMDYDIAIPGGIPDEKKICYDENFIKNVFDTSNIEAIKRLNNFRNFLTGTDENTLKEAIKTRNIVGVGLCLLDKYFFDSKSDGMVYTESQKKVEDILDIKSYKLESTHHDVNSNIRACNELLSIVEDTIAEGNEKKIFFKSRQN